MSAEQQSQAFGVHLYRSIRHSCQHVCIARIIRCPFNTEVLTQVMITPLT